MAFVRSIVVMSVIAVAAASPPSEAERMLSPSPSPAIVVPTPVPTPSQPAANPTFPPMPTLPSIDIKPWPINIPPPNTWTVGPEVQKIYDDAKGAVDAMPLKEKVGVGVAGAAGLAAIGGAIGGIAHAVEENKEANAAPSGIVEVVVPVEVPVTIVPGEGPIAMYSKSKNAVAPAPKVGLGGALPKEAAGGMSTSVAAFLFFGCIFLGISGVIYFVRGGRGAVQGRTQSRTFSRLSDGDDEVELSLADEAAGEDADPLLA